MLRALWERCSELSEPADVSPGQPQRSKMGRRRLAAAAVLAALAAVALVVFLVRGHPGGSAWSYPQRLPDGARPVEVVVGEKAVEATRGIHWEPGMIEIKDAAIVTYSDGTRLWLSYAGSRACELLDMMARQMTLHQEELPYTAPMSHTVEGAKVYISFDKRTPKLHIFWCRGGVDAWAEIPLQPYQDSPGKLMDLMKLLIRETGYRG